METFTQHEIELHFLIDWSSCWLALYGKNCCKAVGCPTVMALRSEMIKFWKLQVLTRDLHAIACAVSPLSLSHAMNSLSCGKKGDGHNVRVSKTLRCVSGRVWKSFSIFNTAQDLCHLREVNVFRDVPCAANNHLRTGADKGNPTV